MPNENWLSVDTPPELDEFNTYGDPASREVLVYHPEIGMYVAFLDSFKGRPFWHAAEDFLPDPTHWMPLPAPPKED